MKCHQSTVVELGMLIEMFQLTDGSSLGLAISNALMLTVIFSFGVSQLTMLDNQLIAVERVVEYIDIPAEGELVTPGMN